MARYDFRTPRLFVATPLGAGLTVTLEADQIHYLADVMRMTAGDPVLVWRAARQLGIPAEAAEPATATGLVEFSGQVRFCHPRARAAIYRAALAPIAERLVQLGGLRPGIEAADVVDLLWFYFGYASYFTLTDDNGWSYEHAERWLGGQATTALLSG